MRKLWFLALITIFLTILNASFKKQDEDNHYTRLYKERLQSFKQEQLALIATIRNTQPDSQLSVDPIKSQISAVRNKLMGLDFWFRYLQPDLYRKINGPLPVEWETEVFEKFEKPYRKEGAGISLAELYLEEKNIAKDSMIRLISLSVTATGTFNDDSLAGSLLTFQHFFLCNRLFLLNLAAIYTTGFECPDTARIIPELRILLAGVESIYSAFDENFPSTALTSDYLLLYKQTMEFAGRQPDNYNSFDHFGFIRDYINPLYSMNQQLINQYKVVSRSFVDYSLNKKNKSIFDKDLYTGQNAKGIFLRVDDPQVLAQIDAVGKLLFNDPILSGNNMRSCASCHKATEYFTDNTRQTSLQFNRKDFLPRNSPTLINVGFNHLLMLDGRHLTLQDQTRAVMMNQTELGSNEEELMKKVLSCPDYKKVFTKLLEYTPQEPEITLDHICSAITFYYSKYSNGSSEFDDAMNGKTMVPDDVKLGFNLFMGKAKCATCHFVPQFNGVKPPFVGSEFEVIGVPSDTGFSQLSADSGRFKVNPAPETFHAFRTGSLRNAQYTSPYMHNGVFKTMEEVIDFYDAGGGVGKGLLVENQTLPTDSLRLSKEEKKQLIQFINSLNENISFEAPPVSLPKSAMKSVNGRKVGGVY